ncbi:MAG: flagellar motor switch protein FliM [Gammaproteobacteria bacterium]
MSATDPEANPETTQDSVEESTPDQNSEAEDTTEDKSEKSSAVEGDEDWDGEDRRSEDRPWSDSDKGKEAENEILSDEERDALSGEVEQLTDELGVTTYDFYSPAHINKSSFPTLAVINEKLIELMTEGLTNLLQREVVVTTGDVDITRYGDFIHSLPVLVDTSIVNISKIDVQSLVCIDGALIEIVMDSYFGGEGKLSEASDKQEFTDTEFNLSNKILEMFLMSNKSAWEKTEPLDFEFVQRESQPKLINLIEETQLVVVCQFKVSLDEEASYIRIAYPYKGLDSIKKSLRSMVPERGESDDGQWKIKFFNSVKAAPIELKTILAEFNLTVDEVIKLKTGDVIPFSMPEAVTVYSSSTPIFTGKIGSVNDAVAISINSWIREQ